MIDSDVINATIDRAQHVVLVVDDNPATRYSTSRILRAAGFRTAEAGSGGEALAQAPEGMAAVVLDVHLPDMSGFDVCRRLRADDATATLPIVHLSAEFTRNEDRVAGLEAGADGYLVHPVEPAILVATLQALIRARTAEDRLRRSEVRFRAVYDHAPSGIVLLDREGRIVDANPAMRGLLGRDKAQLVGTRLLDLVPADVRPAAERQVAAHRQDLEPWQGRFPLLGAAGRSLHFEWSMSGHVEPGVRIAIATDATERVQLEQQRREVLEREQAARAAAERHSRTKDDFIAVLSHELRTPLNAIMGWVAVLLRRGPAPDAVKGLEAIERNVKTQARIISDILDVSRINSGKLLLERAEIDPAKLVTDALASLRGALEDRRLTLDVDVSRAGGPAWLDAERFQQVVWNLMTNAIKFSRPGGQIRVHVDRQGSRLHLLVQDFGQGIRPEFMARLFDRFSQSDAPGNRVHGGLGLGLSIVRQLAELHGGRAWAESAGEGQGATMHVELDVARPDAGEPSGFATDSLPAPLEPDARPLEGLDILVVEDDADASEMLSMVLADRGATVRVAVDVDTALEALESRRPDVLLSDIGLPVRDGYELIAAVRALEPQAGDAPLAALALTAFARPEDRRRALDAGFDEHLTKPLNANALVRCIQGVVRGRR